MRGVLMMVRHRWIVTIEGDPAAVDDATDWLITTEEFLTQFGVTFRMTDQIGIERIEG